MGSIVSSTGYSVLHQPVELARLLGARPAPASLEGFLAGFFAFKISGRLAVAGILSDFGMFAEKTINEVEYARWVISNGHPEEGSLEHGSEQRRTETLAGNICD